MEIKNGDIIRFHSDDTRDWVAIYLSYQLRYEQKRKVQ